MVIICEVERVLIWWYIKAKHLGSFMKVFIVKHAHMTFTLKHLNYMHVKSLSCMEIPPYNLWL